MIVLRLAETDGAPLEPKWGCFGLDPAWVDDDFSHLAYSGCCVIELPAPFDEVMGRLSVTRNAGTPPWQPVEVGGTFTSDGATWRILLCDGYVIGAVPLRYGPIHKGDINAF